MKFSRPKPIPQHFVTAIEFLMLKQWISWLIFVLPGSVDLHSFTQLTDHPVQLPSKLCIQAIYGLPHQIMIVVRRHETEASPDAAFCPILHFTLQPVSQQSTVNLIIIVKSLKNSINYTWKQKYPVSMSLISLINVFMHIIRLRLVGATKEFAGIWRWLYPDFANQHSGAQSNTGLCVTSTLIKLRNTLLFVEYNYNMEQSEFLNMISIIGRINEHSHFYMIKISILLEFWSTVTACFV